MRLLPIAAPVAASLALMATTVFAEAPGPAVPSGNAVTSLTGTFVDATGNRVGNVQVHQGADGTVKVIADATLIPKGAHAISVNAAGVCTPANKFAAAGATTASLPGIGTATVEQGYYLATTTGIKLSGAGSIADGDGASIVIYASDSAGSDRIACAVIAAPDPSLATPSPKPPTAGTGVDAGPLGGESRTVAIAAAFALAAGAFVAGMRKVAGSR
ncbi:MAG: hypothetical protein IT302_00940 [Dehalococcoidia bacterium]|nr:hypothetical protein [Dehalococcoidia bacterium]